jgi:hypothetical protein
VSWIGRIHYGGDARIERIQVDPIIFPAGTATLTAEGQEQVTRVAAFLQQAAELRMALTPIVSAPDLATLKRHALDAEIERVTGQRRLAPDAAVAHLFKTRFPDRPVPDGPGPMRAALLESEPIPPTAASELAAQRLDAVRATMKRAGIEAARLPQKSEVVDASQDVDGHVALDLVEPESPPRRPPQRREVFGISLPGFQAPK